MKFSRLTIPLWVCLWCVIGMTVSCSSDGKRGNDKAAPGKLDSRGSANLEIQRPGPDQELAPNNLRATSASFSPDGKRFVVAFARETGPYTGPKWKMWDVESGKEVKWPNIDFRKKYPDVRFISYLPEDNRILTFEHPNACRIWDAEKILLLREFDLENMGGIALSADGKSMLAFGQGGVAIYDLETGSTSLQLKSKIVPLRGTLSPDGRWVAVEAHSLELAYFDVKNNKVIYYAKDFYSKNDAEKQEPFLNPLLFSPDSKIVLASKMKGSSTAGIALCDAATLKEITQIGDVGRIKQAAFMADGQRLLILDHLTKDGYPLRLRCWELKANRELWASEYAHYDEPPDIGMIVPSPKSDLVLLVNRGFRGDVANNQPANLILLSARTGEIVSRVDADVFPYANFTDPNDKTKKH